MKKPVVICVAIHKGGSAKTTLSGNLAYALGKMKKKVLLIDTDSQKNLSHSYGFTESDIHYENKNFFTLLGNVWIENSKDGNIKNHIMKTDYDNIDIVIGSRNLAKASESLGKMDYAEQIVEDILEPVRKEGYYDFIIIDTDSTLGTLNTSIIQASDGVLISLTPSSFGIEGLATFISNFKVIKKRSKSNVEIFGIVFSDIDKRESMSIEVPEVITNFINKNEPSITIFANQIPKDANINKSQAKHTPIGDVYPNSKSVQAYEALAKEVIRYVKNK